MTTDSTSTDSTADSTTPAELAVFDPGPCLGAFVTASGSGFSPGEEIQLLRDGVLIETVPAGGDGTFAVRVDIEGVQNGEHEITAIGTLSGFTAIGVFGIEPQVCTETRGTTAIVVVVTGSTWAASTAGTPLASTGFPAGPVLGFAILALVFGTMLIVTARNRRQASLVDGPSENLPHHQ